MNQIENQLLKIRAQLATCNKSDISLDAVADQLAMFLSGVNIPQLVKPCKLRDGIIKIDRADHQNLIDVYKSAAQTARITKFVPASGAASRMFQKLQSVINRFNDISLKDLEYHSQNDNECKSAYEFLINLKKFAFYDDIKAALKANDNEIEALINDNPLLILKTLLLESEMNYTHKPKGTIKFHKYGSNSRTAFEEQVYESLNYIADKHNNLKTHFTISEEHTELFWEIIGNLKSKIEPNGYNLNVDYSYQKKSTNTIAVDLDNNILFDENGDILLRPAGHGALLENLNELSGDIIVIKNIDNISTEKFYLDIVLFKKLLIGLLVQIQDKLFEFLRLLETNKLNQKDYDDIFNFYEKYLALIKPLDFEKWSNTNKNNFLFEKLNRPLRVCGMVENKGEPGGGPFWIQNENGELSLQIIEEAQINLQDEEQKKIFTQSTHFNPVDIICGVKDYKGNNFNLMKFRDNTSAVITKKFRNGIELKALELPGLWNGSMSFWNTIFVEVPISTFNPVKEVNDLLRPAHQN